MIKKSLAIAAGISLLLSAQLSAAAETIPAYNTYQSVPFQVGRDGSLASDLVNYVNEKLQGQYTLELKQMPRRRLNDEVLTNPAFDGVVLFLAPPWVGDAGQYKYLWSEPVFTDHNLIVSRPDTAIEYSGPASLTDHRFAGIIGNFYSGLQSIDRSADTTAELSNLKNLISKRIDVTLIADSIFSYYLTTNSNRRYALDKMHVSSSDHASYNRYLFTSSKNTGLAQALKNITASMNTDQQWLTILAKYGINPRASRVLGAATLAT